ncbi:MAG: hypothetical protein KVP17_002047 [Porospora cf. gigantea B]|uniref:uncharacterized protein n=1 Tax=Porospora cf. gigantea B TaxID=2853592 RepID=UPI003571DD9F|nr:MAG: hypothetical protein KVP17_002047 [Porospora cf. gigantea B]
MVPAWFRANLLSLVRSKSPVVVCAIWLSITPLSCVIGALWAGLVSAEVLSLFVVSGAARVVVLPIRRFLVHVFVVEEAGWGVRSSVVVPALYGVLVHSVSLSWLSGVHPCVFSIVLCAVFIPLVFVTELGVISLIALPVVVRSSALSCFSGALRLVLSCLVTVLSGGSPEALAEVLSYIAVPAPVGAPTCSGVLPCFPMVLSFLQSFVVGIPSTRPAVEGAEVCPWVAILATSCLSWFPP